MSCLKCGCRTAVLLRKSSHNLLMRYKRMASRHHKRISRMTTSHTSDTSSSNTWDRFLENVADKEVKGEVAKGSDKEDLFQPVVVPPKKTDGTDIGAELTGVKIKKDELLKLLRDFYSQPKTQLLAAEHGLDITIFRKSFESFRRYCVETEQLPVEFHIVLSDILAGAGHVDDIFPYFLQHARQVFPHLECIEELRHISDLTEPVNWYPQARKIERKVIYHVGPTNSGKTYHALQRFYSAKSGVYCGPLRMLAVEVFNKCNDAETPCDLVTGEDRRQANPDHPAEHVACTVEMTSLTNNYEIAIIDEIQMLRDLTRGWAWTRALLGLSASEIHVCGEASALGVVQELVENCGDEFEVRRYDRLTKLTVLNEAVGSLNNVVAGDCIVCFSKNDIYSVTQRLEALGHQCAVIYGGLPPGTKYAQAEKFNDPDDSCSILVATDAIGMGLNLSIKRIIFFSIVKPTTDKDGGKQMERITTSQALQIAGRAGRYGTQYEDGEVTTFRKEDLPILKSILAGTVDPIEQVGLHPTAEQIELFAYHLPKATLSNLIDIFIHLCKLDHETYFMCNMEDFKFLANMIEHMPLPLRIRYVLCCAPISSQQTFVCNMFLKFARQYSTGRPVTYDWLMEKMKAPFSPPKTLPDLVHLEQAFDVFDLYLWLGYRFPDMFPDMEFVRESQAELDYVIQGSVAAITALLKGQTPKVKPAVTISTEKVYGKIKRPSELSKSKVIGKKRADGEVDRNQDKEEVKEAMKGEPGQWTMDKVNEGIEAEVVSPDKVGVMTSGQSNIIQSEDKIDISEEIINKEKTDKNEINETYSQQNEVDHIGDTIRNMKVSDRKGEMNEIFNIKSAFNKYYQQSKGRIPQTREPFIKTDGFDLKRRRLFVRELLDGRKAHRNVRNRRLAYPVSMNLSEFFQSAKSAKLETLDEPLKEGTLTRALTDKGLITKEMLAQLQKEWLEAQKRTVGDSGDKSVKTLNSDASDVDSDSDREKS